MVSLLPPPLPFSLSVFSRLFPFMTILVTWRNGSAEIFQKSSMRNAGSFHESSK